MKPIKDHGPSELYQPAFDAAFDLLVTRNPRFTEGRLTSEDLLAPLLALSEGERFSAVSSGEFPAQPDLVFEILTRSRQALGRFPAESDHLARLALALAQCLDAETYPAGLIVDQQAESWSLITLARLGRKDLLGARLALTTAQCLLTAGSGDPLSLAMVYTARAHLQARMGDLHASVQTLDTILDLYTEVEDPHLRGAALIQRGLVHRELGNQAQFNRDVSGGLFLLDSEETPEIQELCLTALEPLLGHLPNLPDKASRDISH